MSKIIKNLIKRTFIYDLIKKKRERQIIKDWEKRGKPIPPPPIIKQRTVKEYVKKFSIQTLIETGTYYGDMIDVTKDMVKKIFSIELDERLHKLAKDRFAEFKHISIIHGDSAKKLPEILANINTRCLFWLDSHYSGDGTAKGDSETPIMQEINAILNHKISENIILIDDARFFIGKKDYPTLQELKNLILKKHPDWVFIVENDIIRIYKKSTKNLEIINLQ